MASEKKTCFVLGDGEIGYPGCDVETPATPEQGAAQGPGATSASTASGSTERLKSPPPVTLDGVGWWDTAASAPKIVAEWRSDSMHADSDSSGTDSDGRTPSRATSLRSCGRSPTPSLGQGCTTDDATTPVLSPTRQHQVCRKRRRKERRSTTPQHRPHPHPKRRRLPRLDSHFLLLPAEVLRPICSFCEFPDIIAMQQTNVAMRRMVPPCLEVLDLSSQTKFSRQLSSLLIRLSLEGMRLKCFSLSAKVDERFSGVIGFVLKSSPHLRTLEINGYPKMSLLLVASKYCRNLKEFLQISTEEHAERFKTSCPPCNTSLDHVLRGSKHLQSVTLGRTISAAPLAPGPVGCVHHSLKKLRLDGLVSSAFPTRCDLPNLNCLAIFEGPGAPLALDDLLSIMWNSPALVHLTIAASFTWTPNDVETLHSRCQGLERLRLKSGSDGAERWSSDSPTAQVSGATFDKLYATFPNMRELHIEAAGWDPHWTPYYDLVGADALVLQTELQCLQAPLLRHLQVHNGLRGLQVVVLYGDVSNRMVWEIFAHCRSIRRLELYLLATAEADDDLLSPPQELTTLPIFPILTLLTLHIHDASGTRTRVAGEKNPGLGCSISEKGLVGLGTKFPNLKELGLVGLCRQSAQGGMEDNMECVMEAVSSVLPPCLTHLTLGPVLRTSTELLSLVKSNLSLTSLDLAWHGGQLPQTDDEFDEALGLITLSSLVTQINPHLTVRDVGNGHFNILLSTG